MSSSRCYGLALIHILHGEDVVGIAGLGRYLALFAFADTEGALLANATCRCGSLRLLESFASWTDVLERRQVSLAVWPQEHLILAEMVRNFWSAATFSQLTLQVSSDIGQALNLFLKADHEAFHPFAVLAHFDLQLGRLPRFESLLRLLLNSIGLVNRVLIMSSCNLTLIVAQLSFLAISDFLLG